MLFALRERYGRDERDWIGIVHALATNVPLLATLTLVSKAQQIMCHHDWHESCFT